MKDVQGNVAFITWTSQTKFWPLHFSWTVSRTETTVNLSPLPTSTLLYYISLLSGLWNIDDQHRNPNMNNKDHHVGQLTRPAGAILNAKVLQLSHFSNFSLANKCIHCVWELHLLRGLRGIWIKSASIACGAAGSSYAQMRREREIPSSAEMKRQWWGILDVWPAGCSPGQTITLGKNKQTNKPLKGLEGQLIYGQR